MAQPKPPRGGALSGRPFGAHVHARWWTPIVVTVALVVIMLIAQLVLVVIAMIIDALINGEIDVTGALTPMMLLATNLSLALMLPLSLLAMRWIAGVPWRAALSSGRAFSWKRLGLDTLVIGAIFVLAYAVIIVIAPEYVLLGPVTLTGTAVLFLLIALTTTPFQAAAEEVMFRGTLMPLFGSWAKKPGLALGIGLAASSIAFGLAHGATDPWLAVYYTLFGVCAAVMAVISRGLEAPIAFHMVNNVINWVFTAVSMGDQPVVLDRSAETGAGGPWVLAILALDVVIVGIVAVIEKIRRNRENPTPGVFTHP